MRRIFVATFCALVLLTGLAEGQAQTTNTNTVVRFRFSYKLSHVGDVDVELFDQDKPITVSNFLAYVELNLYRNNIINQLVPGVVLQGGEYAVGNPLFHSPFETVFRVPSLGNITNEYNVGIVRSNSFGTIGMAKVEGDANSANSAWYFNLADNAAEFATNNGGYTVFGRVKDAAGLKVLKSFAEDYYSGHQLMDMTDFFYYFQCAPLTRYPEGGQIAFPSIPVSFTGLDCIFYDQLLAVQVFLINGPDVIPPKVIITSPKAGASLTNDSFVMTGTATDNLAVTNVQVGVNGSTNYLDAQGTNHWSITLTNLPPGTNTIFVTATDASGNEGNSSVTIFRSVRVPLLLNLVGAGTLSGATNGQLMELTRPVTLVAKPDPGNLFQVWTGAFTQVQPTLRFNMESNLAFTALFATNLFPYVKGTYSGIFHNATNVEQWSSGFLTLTLGDFGGYSAKVSVEGRAYKMSGTFLPGGGETNLVVLFDGSLLRFLMTLDLSGGSDQITGLARNSDFGDSILKLDRAVFDGKLHPAPLAGAYTLVFPGTTNAAGPHGDGYAALKVDGKGGITFKGLLADNTKLSYKATVSKLGDVPIYLSLYKGAGALVSWLHFDTNQVTTDCGGLLDWFKQTQVKAKYYSRGFTNQINLEGSRYLAPVLNRVLDLTNAVVGFTNGNLSADFANTVILGADNKIVNTSSNRLTLTLSKSSGLLSGSVTPPGATKALSVKGALLQKQNRGAGLLLGTNKTSKVSLGL